MAGRGKSREVESRALLLNKKIPAQQLVALPEGLDTNPREAFVQRAREHLRAARGFQAFPAEFEGDPSVQTTSGGAVAVHFRQQFKSIPIFLAAQTVRFTPQGAVEETVGTTFQFSDDVKPEPRVAVADAVRVAAQHVNTDLRTGLLGEADDFGNPLDTPSLDLGAFQPAILATFAEVPERPSVLAAGPFGAPIKASLTWFPDQSGLRLGWEVLLTMPQAAGQYRVIVDANTREILYSRQLADLIAARGKVYVASGGAPRELTTFPRAWGDYATAFDPQALPASVPATPVDWVDDARRDTFGNCVNAHLGDSGPPLKGKAGPDGTVLFDPQEDSGDEQKILNIFYFNSYLHDLFYVLGFREEDGNFQLKGTGGQPGDPVEARAHSGVVWGTANMLTPPDGTSPTMNMGLVANTNRHTAFDATVVFHEYMHGVTNRLVGGALNTHALEEPQSKAMGEGWGDYVACVLTNSETVGHWVTSKQDGIRSKRYDTNYPGRFGHIGQSPPLAPTDYTQNHRVGEIWCATLMEMSRSLNARLGAPRGQRFGLQLVVDALKLSPANPSMLDMRDAILKALEHKTQGAAAISATDHAAVRRAIWAAFAKFGMGANARTDGAKFTGIVQDFTDPSATAGQPAEPGTQPSAPSQPSPPSQPSGPGGAVQMNDPANAPIPDGDPAGLTRTLNVSGAAPAKRLTIHVDVMHPYVGDLKIMLTPPNRSAILLYDQAFAGAPNLVRDYTPENTPALASLLGQSLEGEWKLTVADLSPGDTGTLRAWSIDIQGEAAAATATSPAAAAAGFAETASPLTATSTAANPVITEVARFFAEMTRLLETLVKNIGTGPRP